MPDATTNLLESLGKTPALVELFKRDPVQLLTLLANCEQGQAAMKAGTQFIGDLVTRCSAGAKQLKNSKPVALSSLDSDPFGASLTSEPSPEERTSSVAIVGVTSLAAITGVIAVLGTVSIIAISKED